jgi:hypothetical protein
VEVSAYGIALIGGGFTVIGALLSYWPSRWLMDRHNLILAKSKLRASFAQAQARIKLTNPDEGHIICNFIKEYIPGHAAAIEEFRPFVSESDRDKYQKAWDDYCKTATQHHAKTYGEAAGPTEIRVDKLFREKIHAILAFAK